MARWHISAPMYARASCLRKCSDDIQNSSIHSISVVYWLTFSKCFVRFHARTTTDKISFVWFYLLYQSGKAWPWIKGLIASGCLASLMVRMLAPEWQKWGFQFQSRHNVFPFGKIISPRTLTPWPGYCVNYALQCIEPAMLPGYL